MGCFFVLAVIFGLLGWASFVCFALFWRWGVFVVVVSLGRDCAESGAVCYGVCGLLILFRFESDALYVLWGFWVMVRYVRGLEFAGWPRLLRSLVLCASG